MSEILNGNWYKDQEILNLIILIFAEDHRSAINSQSSSPWFFRWSSFGFDDLLHQPLHNLMGLHPGINNLLLIDPGGLCCEPIAGAPNIMRRIPLIRLSVSCKSFAHPGIDIALLPHHNLVIRHYIFTVNLMLVFQPRNNLIIWHLSFFQQRQLSVGRHFFGRLRELRQSWSILVAPSVVHLF